MKRTWRFVSDLWSPGFGIGKQDSVWSSALAQRNAWSEILEKTSLTAVKSRLVTSAYSLHSGLAVGMEISMTKGMPEECAAWKDEAAYRAGQKYWAKAAVWAAAVSTINAVLSFDAPCKVHWRLLTG